MFPGSDTGLTCSEASPTRRETEECFEGLIQGCLVVKHHYKKGDGRVFPGSDTGLTCSEASPTRRETEECFQGLIQG